MSSAALALAVALLLPATAGATTDTYDYTGDVQSGVVPAGVTSATFDLYGAEGGTAVRLQLRRRWTGRARDGHAGGHSG
ncbi:MAG: hypothetical protein M9964_04640 [Solirubrobacterales bacterium]|nr:hypothetical protein [Solirubrobacterales bacterium]